MSRYIEIPLRIKPYLRKYVTLSTNQHQLLIDPKSEIGSHVVKHLHLPPSGWRPERIPSEEKLVLLVPRSFISKHRLGCYLSASAKDYIAALIEELFWRDLSTTVHYGKIRMGKKELQIIRSVRDTYGITEDLYKEESMYKRYQRIKKTARSLAVANY